MKDGRDRTLPSALTKPLLWTGFGEQKLTGPFDSKIRNHVGWMLVTRCWNCLSFRIPQSAFDSSSIQYYFAGHSPSCGDSDTIKSGYIVLSI